tara:strand:+ start:208 stop:756 length:549 start_codon:yes stop_codon:yes gene_type:complete
LAVAAAESSSAGNTQATRKRGRPGQSSRFEFKKRKVGKSSAENVEVDGESEDVEMHGDEDKLEASRGTAIPSIEDISSSPQYLKVSEVVMGKLDEAISEIPAKGKGKATMQDYLHKFVASFLREYAVLQRQATVEAHRKRAYEAREAERMRALEAVEIKRIGTAVDRYLPALFVNCLYLSSF